ncbi:MAG: thiamine transport system ATP-binding protein, partial [Parvicella sp.]
QRIALLRTLLRPEPLVLLDEPFTGLDNHSRVLAANWVRQQVDENNKTVLLVTHQDEDVAQIADRNFELD